MSDAIIARIARRYEGRWLRGYVRGKLRSDPIYDAGLDVLKDSPLPLLDVGCGIGLLACWLREHGSSIPIRGVDLDAGKVAAARRATASYPDVTFHVGEATEPQDLPGNVTVFDVLHLLPASQQRILLTQVATTLAPGARCLIRATIHDASWRFRMTRIEDWWLRASRWMNSDAIHYPTRTEVEGPFRDRGCTVETRPLWGRTPFNSHLFVFRAP